jgi:mono/diheme cytochrome c family protein
MTRSLYTICLLLVAAGRVSAAPVDFVRDVQPIFAKHCYSCHGEKKQKSGLRLDIKAKALAGGELYGPSVVAGKAKDSPLVQFVADEDANLQMPPDGERLSAAEVDALTRWVNEGASWPDGVDTAKLVDLRDHWSFKPLLNPRVPAVKDERWPRGEIDRFILARLEKEGLRPSTEADRVAWLRRVYFDLIGLPPTPEQIAAFVGDSRDDAFERVVDELLQSPRYGERWAQHWFDVVRYADTHGFEVNTERPNAWPYRDYVIRALNDDVPYDQFIREQIVGDALERDAATGFLVTASVLLPGQIGADEPSKRLARQDAIDEIVTNIGQTFLGMSVGCARCHDHKFDPVSQQEYFAMQAFVAGVEYGDRELQSSEAKAAREKAEAAQRRLAEVDTLLTRFVPPAKSGVERPMVNARLNIDRFSPTKTKRVRFTIEATNLYEPCIDELEVFNAAGKNVALASSGAAVTSSGDNVSPNRHELRLINDGEYGNSRSWMSSEPGKGWVVVEFAEEQEIDRVVWGRDRQGKFADRLATRYKIEVEIADAGAEAGVDGGRTWRVVADASDRAKFDGEKAAVAEFSTAGLSEEEAKQAAALLVEKRELEKESRVADDAQQVFAGVFRKPDEIRLLTRGNPEQPKDVVTPAVPAALGELRLAGDVAEQTRRKALADWIADAKNPLTARVMINRIWQGHFGVGLVETASDFGRSGQPPTHPELLDWLAGEFVRGKWSIKRMHRLIVLSATYRQASTMAVGEEKRPATKLASLAASPSAGSETNSSPRQLDADCRLLWAYPSRRLDAETIRDAMLAVGGQLDLKMYGRGFDLFNQRGGLSGFTPVEHFTGDGLRRMVYAHKVRRERDAVFGAFDCPDAGQSTPRRRESTTPIQALNLFNSRFTLDQSEAFAQRVRQQAGEQVSNQIHRAYQLALGRVAAADELRDAEPVVREHGLGTLTRALLNSNEFLFTP